MKNVLRRMPAGGSARRAGGHVALAAGILLVASLPCATPARAEPATVQQVEIRTRAIEYFRIGSDERRFGPLEFVGGLEMVSSSRDFGSISALRFLEPGGRFACVADTGFFCFGAVERDGAGKPTGIADFTMQEMVDRRGEIIGEKGATDAEGLAIRDGVATVSFERRHRVSEFALDPTDMKAATRDLDFLVPAWELRQNRGFETVTFAHPHGIHEGARIVVSEKSLDKAGNIFAAIIEGAARGVFTVRRHGEFDITDGAVLPNGDLLILERSFSMARGVGMRLRRLYGEFLMKGEIADGPILLEADMGYQIDNMEGLDVWQRADGATVVSIVSDDNHSILQRNLYLEFVLHEE